MTPTSAAMSRRASGIGAWPMSLKLMYSQYVPTAKVPALNQKPSTAARLGVAPSQSHMSTAGMRMASGHHPNGANDSASSTPATNATPLPTNRRCRNAGGVIRPGSFGRQRPVFGRHDVVAGRQPQGLDAAAVEPQHLHLESGHLQGLAAARQAPELFHDDAG